MKNPVDPLEELREIKRKKSRELARARRKGTLLEKLREMDERASKFLQPRKKAGSR
jgi:hypothetical protein